MPGSRLITEIKTPQLVATVKGIEARGVGDLTKRALETDAQIFRYAPTHNHAKRNPSIDGKPRDILNVTVEVNLIHIEAKIYRNY